MKKEWSSKWVSSTQPRKQRKFRHNAPLHARRRFLSVHLAPELRRRFGKRAVPVRKGDEIKVLVGNFKGTRGKVEKINTKQSKVYCDEIKVKKADGSEVMRALRPSNLILTSLNLDDKARAKTLERVRAKPEAKKPEAKKPPKEEKPKPPKEEKPKPEKKPPKKEKPKKEVEKK